MIAIVDFGVGNLGSIHNMLSHLGVDSKITGSAAEIEDASKLILPGVGSFDNAMSRLRALELVDVLNQRVLGDKVPILGICLGMQILVDRSDEGDLDGLGWIEGEARRLEVVDGETKLRLPHMGWRPVRVENNLGFFDRSFSGSRYYFVHTYGVICNDPATLLASAKYGTRFTAVIGRANIIGTQFHPEKSHKHGMRLLRGFASW